MYATATLEPVSAYYPDVREKLCDLDNKLDEARNDWMEAHANGETLVCDDLERKAYALNAARTDLQFRLNRHADEVIAEKYNLDNNVDYDSDLPQTDAEWLSWKVNKFIKNISHRTSKGSLYVGRVRLQPVNDGWFEFRCYSKGCSFHARHYVGSDHKRVELRIARILAHYYKHA